MVFSHYRTITTRSGFKKSRYQNSGRCSSERLDWSICVSSINGEDLTEIESGIIVRHEVPARLGERKRFIVDTFHK